MRIAIVGVRGIPVVYSGFETFAEELSTRLVKRGHQVTVYGRRGYVDEKRQEWKGVKLVTLPSVRSKHLETISHSFLSTMDICKKHEVHVTYYLGVGSSIVSLIPRLFGIRTIVNVDGLDYKREKWGKLAQKFLKFSEYLALWCPNYTLTDSRYIQKYYKSKYQRTVEMIPYGYDTRKAKSIPKLLSGYGIERNKYLVWTGRMVPDNHLDELIKAYRRVKQDNIKLVVVGDDKNETGYREELYRLARGEKKILFLGWLDREKYAEVVREAYAYVETKRSGGTHPSLVEVMGYGQLVLANDFGSTKEVLGETGVYYRSGQVKDLENKLRSIMKRGFVKKGNEYRKLARERAITKYGWTRVIRTYEQLFKKMVG